jgi:murein DD-endopeptidase MepM/ murein hydrolase activator NlpD
MVAARPQKFPVDGSLALRAESAVVEIALDSRPEVSPTAQLKRARPTRGPHVSPRPKAVDEARRARRRRTAGHERARRVALLVAASAAVGITLLLTAFGSSSTAPARTTAPAPAHRLLPSGPPRPQVIALRDSLRIQTPISQTRVTAIGYHGVDNGALPLEPVGRQANEGALARLVRRIAGTGDSGITYYQLGGEGPETAVLDVGAPPGTDVYAPVDGTVVGITGYVVSGRRLGSRIDIQPSSAPSLVVSLTHLRSDPALTVGTAVTAASSKIGTVLDFSRVERQSLARYTQDAGNHVSLEVHPAATLAIP